MTVREYAERIVSNAASLPSDELLRRLLRNGLGQTGLAKVLLKDDVTNFTLGELVELEKVLDKVLPRSYSR